MLFGAMLLELTFICVFGKKLNNYFEGAKHVGRRY